MPYAFYANTEMVGFTTLAYEPGSMANYWIFHFFIDTSQQGRGYGKKALQLFLRFIKDQYSECRSIQLTVHPENKRAQRLYLSEGFLPTGTEVDGEPVYRLVLKGSW